MPVYYISILRARQSFDPCAFVLCASSRLSPIPRLLFIAADMPQRFCSRFADCRTFPLFSALFFAADMPQRFCSCFEFFLAFSLSPFRFLSPPCAEVFSLALRFVPPLLAAFFRVHALARFAVRALTANRSALKKPPR